MDEFFDSFDRQDDLRDFKLHQAAMDESYKPSFNTVAFAYSRRT